MALRLSTGLRDFLLENGSLKRALQGGRLKIYSGTQPASADDVPAGTLLNTITLASGANTAEVISTGSLVLSSGTGSSVDTVTVDGNDILGAAVAWDTDFDTTMAAVTAQINDNISNENYTASYDSGSDTMTISALPGTGTDPNGYVVDYTVSGGSLVLTKNNMASGVLQINGLIYGDASSGQLVKGSGIWSGAAVATGTAGWFRYEGPIADDDSSSTELIRIDGNIGTSGANLNMSSTSITSGATTTIDTFAITLPAS